MSSSTYTGGRRAPNVSQYLANLNTIPSAHDLPQNDLSFPDEGLDFLANTEFFDFDSFDPNAVDYNPPAPPQAGRDVKPLGLNGQPYGFTDFQNFGGAIHSSAPALQNPQPAFPTQFNPHVPYSPADVAAAAPPQAGDKRKASIAGIATPPDLEDQSRLAAEEDKRRRNTAASARFRVKKKQREQALEKQAKEMTDKVQSLENKVQQLELENKWLKSLITEKGDAKSIEDLRLREKAADERSKEQRTKGVGTLIKPEGEEKDDDDSEVDE